MKGHLLACAIICTLLIPGTCRGEDVSGPRLLRTDFAVNGTDPCLVRTPTGYLLAYNVGKEDINSLYVVNSTDCIHWGTPHKVENVSTGAWNTSIETYDMILARNGTYILLYFSQSMIWVIQSRDAISWSAPINITAALMNTTEQRYRVYDMSLIQTSNGSLMLGCAFAKGSLAGKTSVSISISPDCIGWSRWHEIYVDYWGDIIAPGDIGLMGFDLVQSETGRFLTILAQDIFYAQGDCQQSTSNDGVCWTVPATCMSGNATQPALLEYDSSSLWLANYEGLYSSSNGSAWEHEWRAQYSEPAIARVSTNEMSVAYVADYHDGGRIMVDRFLTPGPAGSPPPPTNSTSDTNDPDRRWPLSSSTFGESVCSWMPAMLVIALVAIYIASRLRKPGNR
jgi:hypothetical protein